ncbi:MAG: hypothetical protein AB1611_03045 [bacterium]
MDMVSLVREKRFLGREFLTWLWFQSDSQMGVFTPENGQPVEIWLDNKITLETDDQENVERVICHGEHSEMLEAREALSQGKKVTQASFKMCLNDAEWHFTLDDCWLNFRSCKTPKVMLDTREDPDGIFFEKIFLIQEAVRIIEQLFSQFIKIRISPEWMTVHLPAIRDWIQSAGALAEEKPESGELPW